MTRHQEISIQRLVNVLIAFLGLLMDGVLHHWRWLLLAPTLLRDPASRQVSATRDTLLTAFLAWYNLLRIGVGLIEFGFAV